MKHCHVITAFLCHQEKILLLRRSNKVGSYQGYWSAISGYLEEPTAEQQAYKEIQEETGLLAEQVQLVRAGTPLDVIDAKINTHWVVHPFLYNLVANDSIRLDWENTEFRWVSAEELPTYATVPDLLKAFQHCFSEKIT